jgi:hypothetical protein
MYVLVIVIQTWVYKFHTPKLLQIEATLQASFFLIFLDHLVQDSCIIVTGHDHSP